MGFWRARTSTRSRLQRDVLPAIDAHLRVVGRFDLDADDVLRPTTLERNAVR